MAGTRQGGLKSAKKIRKKYGDDYFTKFASKGGKAGDKKKHAKNLREKYGEDFYSLIQQGGKRDEGNS